VRSASFHLQNTTENTLVVAIKKTADASKACEAEDADILEQRLRTGLACKFKTVLKGCIAELRSFDCRRHLGMLPDKLSAANKGSGKWKMGTVFEKGAVLVL
jgi:hypothetical protein